MTRLFKVPMTQLLQVVILVLRRKPLTTSNAFIILQLKALTIALFANTVNSQLVLVSFLANL